MTSPNENEDRAAASLAARAERGEPRGPAATLDRARTLAAARTEPLGATRPAGRRWATAAAAVLVLGTVAGGVWLSAADGPDERTVASTAPELCELLAAPVSEPTEGAPDVVVYLLPNTSPARRTELAQSFRGTGVDDVREVDEAESYAEFRRLFAAQPAMLASVQPDALPTSIELWLTDPAERADAAESLRSSRIRDVYQVVARADGPSVLDALVWPGHDPTAAHGASSIPTAVYPPPWPAGAEAVARAADADGQGDVAAAVRAMVAEVATRMGSTQPPEQEVPPAVAGRAALIEAAARDRCGLEPDGAFTHPARAETTDTIPTTSPGD